MAVYYVTPYTTTNGDGSWASPFSMSTTTRGPTLVAGDEIRIVGRTLSSLLTATEYTATMSPNVRQLDITAGGGLGADFVAYDIIYFPQYDTFAKLNGVTTNTLSTGANVTFPWYNSSAGQTSVVVRKVNLASFTSITGAGNIWSIQSPWPSNITVTDGWVDDGVRVTDGTVKSLVNTTSTSTSVTFNISSATTANSPTTTVDLSNTILLPGNAVTANRLVNFRLSGATYNIGQIFTNGTSTVLSAGAAATPLVNSPITIKHINGYTFFNNGFSMQDSTINLDNVAIFFGSFLFYPGASSTVDLGAYNCTFNIGNLVANSKSGDTFIYGSRLTKNTINFNGVYDSGSSAVYPSLCDCFGNYTVNFGSGFVYFRTNRTVTVTSITNKLRTTSSFTLMAGTVKTPNIATPPGITISGAMEDLSGSIIGSTSFAHNTSDFEKQPTVTTIHLKEQLTPARFIRIPSNLNLNVLYVHENGSNPIEMLSVYTDGVAATVGSNQLPYVSMDGVVVRTSGPSLKCTLDSRSSTIWDQYNQANRNFRARKTIKVPGIASQNTTVTGYVRNSNITSFANGDVRMCIVYKGNEIVGQDITTASNGNWEQFTLNFTPTETGEYDLVWEMYFINTGAIWLDDLSIT